MKIKDKAIGKVVDVVQVLMETNPLEGDIVATITLNNG